MYVHYLVFNKILVTIMCSFIELMKVKHWETVLGKAYDHSLCFHRTFIKNNFRIKKKNLEHFQISQGPLLFLWHWNHSSLQHQSHPSSLSVLSFLIATGSNSARFSHLSVAYKHLFFNIMFINYRKFYAFCKFANFTLLKNRNLIWGVLLVSAQPKNDLHLIKETNPKRLSEWRPIL